MIDQNIKVAADSIILHRQDDDISVLLVKRGNEP
jgi:ADP-ribose pyrophosphatase YjhB (NUDIX family)